MKTLVEILEILHKSGYIKSQLQNNGITNLELMSLSSLLMQNIRNEWVKNKSDLNIYSAQNNIDHTYTEHYDNSAIQFLRAKHFKENFIFLKTFQNYLPLAIKTFSSGKKEQHTNFSTTLPKQNFMFCDYFFNEIQAYEKFSKIQRERKIWWMKLSVDPGRFHLSDLKTELIKKRKLQSVKIKAKFNFGDIDLENINIIPMKALELENVKEFYLFDKKLDKKVIPVIIHTEICAEIATTAILFDALENSSSEKICLQRNIAPYQCSIFCLLKNDEKDYQDLENLATLISDVLRKSNIRTLNIHKCITDSKLLQKELSKIDEIGVPYSIIIESQSLQNGLMKLRNRDTTLAEEIHISEVPDYLNKIFNSF